MRSRLKQSRVVLFPAICPLFYPFFTVDTYVPRCYKPQKDKLFGGESPNELPSAVRE